MTISSTDREAGPFIGNGSTTALPFDFKVFSASDLLVVRLATSTGVETNLVLNTDYTVTLNADQNANPGGTVTLATALATGFQVTITSNLDYLQPVDLTNQGGFYPSVINDGLDRLVVFIQQILSKVNRSVRLPLSVTGVDAELPIPEASTVLGWDQTGTGLQNYAFTAGLGVTDAAAIDYSPPFLNASTRKLDQKLADFITSRDFGIPGDLTDDGQNHIRLKNAAKEAIRRGVALVICGKVLFSDTVDWDTTGSDYNNLDPNIPNGTAKYLPILSFNSSSGLYAKCSAFSGLNKSCIIHRTQESKVSGLTIRMYNDGAFTYATMRNIKLLQVKTSDRTPIVFNSIGGILEPSGAVSIGAGTNIWLDDCMSPTVEHNFIVYYTRYGVCRDNGTPMDPIAANPVRVSTSGSFIKNYFSGGWPDATSRDQCVSINLGYGDTLVQNVFENNSKGRALYWDNDNNALYNNWHEGTYDTALIGGGFGARWNGPVNLQASPTNCAIEGLYTYSIPGSLAIGTPNPTALNNLDVLNNGFYFGGHLFAARVNAKNGVYTNGVLYQSNQITTDNNTNLITTLGGNGVSLVGTSTKNPIHTDSHIIRSKATNDGAGVLILENANGTNGTSVFFGVGAAGVGYNAANCVIGAFRSSVSGRSINAAGTINASGADYAEYMRKAFKFDLPKGGICGVNKNGELTNVYDDAIAFVVKSTDPCVVGGDIWGTEEALGAKKPELIGLIKAEEGKELSFDDLVYNKMLQEKYEADLAAFNLVYEEARSWYDRIAFCGRCPVNVYECKPGQYIIPFNNNGTIEGKAINEKDLTFDQYKSALGKVIKILDDGRAEVVVKSI